MSAQDSNANAVNGASDPIFGIDPFEQQAGYIPPMEETREAFADLLKDRPNIREASLAIFDRSLAAHDAEVAVKAEDATFDAVQGYMSRLRSNVEGSPDFKAGVDALGSKINHMIAEVKWARAHPVAVPTTPTEDAGLLMAIADSEQYERDHRYDTPERERDA